MSILAAKNTLLYQLKGRPMSLHRDMSNVQCKDVAQAVKEVVPTAGQATPEIEALKFYLLNHAVAIVRQRVDMNQPLGKYLPILEMYNDQLSPASVRMLYYILIICVRETRHLKNSSVMKPKIATLYGSAASSFIASVPDDSSAAMQRFQNHPPACTIGQLVGAMKEAFYKGSWAGGYGGKAWGDVNSCLLDFVAGKFSAEMMMDIAFTLCHNGGPIFNKGMLYTSYHPQTLLKILDVQRAGMIPQLVGNKELGVQFQTPEINDLYKKLSGIIGDEFTGYVDWKAVKSLGAKGTYTAELSQQIATHGVVDSKELAQIKAEGHKPSGKMFEVMANLQVPIIKLQRAA